ncbi:MAG: hypothetical protein M1114_01385 [Candidatus Dependentiae bacterium]|nr:hypothetical protein [Candidatus Dependentiae bacterium]
MKKVVSYRAYFKKEAPYTMLFVISLAAIYLLLPIETSKYWSLPYILVCGIIRLVAAPFIKWVRQKDEYLIG